MSAEHRKNIRLIEKAIGEQELPYGNSEDFEIRINLEIPRKWWTTPQHSNTWVQQKRADFEDAVVALLFNLLQRTDANGTLWRPILGCSRPNPRPRQHPQRAGPELN